MFGCCAKTRCSEKESSGEDAERLVAAYEEARSLIGSLDNEVDETADASWREQEAFRKWSAFDSMIRETASNLRLQLATEFESLDRVVGMEEQTRCHAFECVLSGGNMGATEYGEVCDRIVGNLMGRMASTPVSVGQWTSGYLSLVNEHGAMACNLGC